MTPTFLKGLKDIKDNQSIKSSFFLYDRSRVIKKTFVSELNDFLPIMCSFGYFSTTHNIQNIDLISPKNAQEFYKDKDAIRDRLDFQLKHVSGTELVTDDNKVCELLFTKLSKSKKTMNVLDFIIMRGQQVFEEGRDINPIEIKIEDNRVQNFFDKYKDNKVMFKLIGLLIASSIVNDTEKIFLQTTALKSAKYALLNDEYTQIIGIANLNQIENWDTLKQDSKRVDITFQEQIANKNTLHPSFSFISNSKEDVLNFSLKLLGSNNKIIKFADGERKFPILEFIIEFLG